MRLFLLLLLMVSFPLPSDSVSWRQQVRRLAGDGSVLVLGPEGNTLFSHHSDKPLIPASILKVVTAGAALNYLGPEFRFTTDFRVSTRGDLRIIGRGDPYLVSEELAFIAEQLKKKGLKSINNILLDGSYFSPQLVLHGTSGSHNPYDAYNGALSVNFNTLYVIIDEQGRITSAEPQTPLTEFARNLAGKSDQKGMVRLNIAPTSGTGMLYAGHLFRIFLERAGIEVEGKVMEGRLKESDDELVYRHLSRQDLAGLVSLVFEFSNNFMANQIFLTLGAEKFGPPANAAKSRKAVKEYLSSLGLSNIHIEEGSGLSRRTRITTKQMIKVLTHFRPYRQLLNSSQGVWFKTGSLDGVKTLAGYIERDEARPLSFVIMLQGKNYLPGDCTRILDLLKENLN